MMDETVFANPMIEKAIRLVMGEYGAPVRRRKKVYAWDVRSDFGLVLEIDRPKKAVNIWLPDPGSDVPVPKFAKRYPQGKRRHSNTFASPGLAEGAPALKLQVRSERELREALDFIKQLETSMAPVRNDRGSRVDTRAKSHGRQAQRHTRSQNFQPGKLYRRGPDIHDVYGGQRQGGISTPQNHPYVFIFTGSSGQQYGYEDGWDEDGVFIYTGEGQTGDMRFNAGNKAIRDHLETGKEILLFEALGKSKPVRYVGPVVCASWEYRKGPDKEGNQRKTIVFHLIAEDGQESVGLEEVGPPEVDLKTLRKKAYSAATQSSQGKEKNARQSYYQRSADVRDYVLARASGMCESCEQPAPFVRKDGSPYLEPHHTRRVSDGGPDHPRWVGGICPNCHREIHSGQNGKLVNQNLIEKLGQIEADSLGTD